MKPQTCQRRRARSQFRASNAIDVPRRWCGFDEDQEFEELESLSRNGNGSCISLCSVTQIAPKAAALPSGQLEGSKKMLAEKPLIHTTHWQDAKMSRFPSVKQSLRCDVLIIGGGITGLTAAYLLNRAGKRVCVVERDTIGSGDTCCTTAHLTCVTDTRLSELISAFGKEAARLIWQGGNAAINTIEEVVGCQRIECDFLRIPGYLHASLKGRQDETDSLHQDALLARELGFDATYCDSLPGVNRPGVRFSNQAKFHPLRYLGGLATAIARNGGFVFERSEATDFSENPRTVVSNGHVIECDYLILATHVPLLGETSLMQGTLFQTRLAAYSSYVIGAQVPTGCFPEASFWDTSNPYYYLRVDRGVACDYAIFGGEDHKTGQVDDSIARYESLEIELKKLIPAAHVERHWTGQVIETHDGLPYIGETADRQFAATGFSGNGMTWGTLAGMMACDAVLNRNNPWRTLFSPERQGLSGTWDYLRENFDYPYYLLRNLMFGTAAGTPADVQPGEGRVLRVDGKPVACCRDSSGKLHAVSAVCTHMGCLVEWNNAAGTWDCPCHGSRFSPQGEVIAGPAEDKLEKASLQG